MEINILYKDKYLLLAEKPVGENSQFSNEANVKNLPERLSAQLSSLGEGDFIGLVHRLDAVTGGVILYSRDKNLTGKLSEMVSDKKYKKTYLAVIHGVPAEKEGQMTDLLFFDKQKNKTYVVSKQRRGVKSATLDYKVIESVKLAGGGDATLVKVQLHTGRTHQIRVQFASRKMPLLGDGKYGSRENSCICALWSHRGEFRHPVSGKTVCVESFPPQTYPWNLFNISRETE